MSTVKDEVMERVCVGFVNGQMKGSVPKTAKKEKLWESINYDSIEFDLATLLETAIPNNLTKTQQTLQIQLKIQRTKMS